jgi:MFS family permease
MYSIDWSKIFTRKKNAAQAPDSIDGDPSGRQATGWRRKLPKVSPTVWALGVTSLLTDISSEMIASILPMYLVLHLGMSPLAFGVVDGIYQGAAALVRVVGGVLSDRWRRHKEVAAVGYGLSAACRVLIFVAGNAWTAIGAIIAVDRIGKGIRTAPRDALISQSTPSGELATAFGVHRAMDAVGAMLGPVLAFVLLALQPDAYDVVFVASFAVAILGLAAIILFVPKTSSLGNQDDATPVSMRTAGKLFSDAKFRGLLYTGTLLGIGTISDSFIYLILQNRLGFGVTAFPLLYVGTSLVTALFAVSCGRLADRVGRKRVLIGGYAALALLYITLWTPAGGGVPLVVGAIVLLGLYYAATDGVLTAMTAAALPAMSCGSGLAVFATATNIARLLASVGFGFLWTRCGTQSATLSYLATLLAAIAAAVVLLKPSNRDASQPVTFPPSD